VLFSVVSLAVAGGVLYWALVHADPYFSVVFPSGFSLTSYYRSHILWLALAQGGAVLLLTALSSALAMRKHLKV
jgi:hypothetical protein